MTKKLTKRRPVDWNSSKAAYSEWEIYRGDECVARAYKDSFGWNWELKDGSESRIGYSAAPTIDFALVDIEQKLASRDSD